MACNCRECAAGRIERYALRHGGEDWQEDYEDLIPHRKSSRSNFNGKRKRACKKSKDKEPCNFTVAKVLWQYFRNDEWHYTKVITCSRCGKHGPYSFGVSKRRQQ